MSEYQFEFDPYYVVSEEYDLDVPKLTLFKQDSFEMNFDCPSTQQPIQQNFVYDIFQDNTLNLENAGVKKIQKKSIKKQKPAQRDYKKNICRNILRHAIKSMLNCEICQEFMEGLVDDTDSFKQYYNRVLESITGFRVLKDQLVNLEEDSELVRNRKKAFKIYLTWYLRTRASQMILLGETKNPMEYIKYKNEVLLYYNGIQIHLTGRIIPLRGIPNAAGETEIRCMPDVDDFQCEINVAWDEDLQCNLSLIY